MEVHGGERGVCRERFGGTPPDRPALQPQGRAVTSSISRDVQARARITWTAAPFQLVVVTVLQVLSGLGIAAQVLIARDVLQALVEHQGKGSLHAVLPYVIALALVTAALQFVTTVITEVSRVLSGLVEQHAVGQVVEAATSIDLLEYERPDFHNALQRAPVAAMTRPVQMVSGLTAMLGVITGIIGIGPRSS